MALGDVEHCENYCIHEDRIKEVDEIMISDDELYDIAELFKVFGDSTRMRILYTLYGSELCVCDLSSALNMNQPAVSHQLKILKQAKLIKARRDGKTVYYALSDEHVKTIIAQGRDHIEE